MYDQKEKPQRYEPKDIDEDAIAVIEVDHIKILNLYMQVTIKK